MNKLFYVQRAAPLCKKFITVNFLWLIVLFLQPSPLFAFQTETPKSSGIAMHGATKYGQDFKNFDYVNPNAPQGGALRIGVVGTFDTLNPFIVRGNSPQTPAFDIKGAVYETLMARSWDEPFSLYGLLAESVEVPEDRSSIIFYLRPEARWQDGKPVTADDVLFSFTTLRDKGRPNHRTYYKKVDHVEKLGDHRVRFVFRRDAQGQIDREMPLIMGLMPVLPKHELQNREFNQTTLKPPVGSGPYKITTINPGHSFVLEKDPNYWGKNVPAQRGMYNFDKVQFDFYRDDNIALQAFKAGQFDMRREINPTKWVTGYTSPALDEGRVQLEKFQHHKTEAAYGFIFNTRRPLLKDIVLRKAMSEAFDFDWINKSLFRGLYKRTQSYFPNSELAATDVPKGKEKSILNSYRSKLSPSVFEALEDADCGCDFPPAKHREDLIESAKRLKVAGYVLRDDKLYTAQGEPVTFEILLNDPSEEKVALEWARSLMRLGIEARVHTVDSAQFQARLAAFDFDVTTGRWYNSLSPGNEQIFYWGSEAAQQQGSRNYPGIHDPVVDSLARAVPMAQTREDLVATTRALDRVLLNGYYMVPLYHLGADLVALWATRVAYPEVTPVYGAIPETWWAKPSL